MSKKITTTKKRQKNNDAQDWAGTSIAFKKVNLAYLKEIKKKQNFSVSWVVNRLIEKLKDGEITLQIE